MIKIIVHGRLLILGWPHDSTDHLKESAFKGNGCCQKEIAQPGTVKPLAHQLQCCNKDLYVTPLHLLDDCASIFRRCLTGKERNTDAHTLK